MHPEAQATHAVFSSQETRTFLSSTQNSYVSNSSLFLDSPLQYSSFNQPLLVLCYALSSVEVMITVLTVVFQTRMISYLHAN